MKKEELFQIKQTFPNLEIDDYFIEGEDYALGYMEFKNLKVLKIKLEERNKKYKSLIEDSSDGYVQTEIYESKDLDDFLYQTKSKLAKLFLNIYNQIV